MTPRAAILATLVVYQTVLILIGLLTRRRTRDGADFYLAGRHLGPWVAAISAAASSSSAWTLLGVSGAAYSLGLSALWILPGCVGGFLLNWFVVARPLRRRSHEGGALTLTDILAGSAQGRKRQAIARLCALIILVCLGTYVASQFQGAGKAFSETFGWSVPVSILVGSAIVIFYTLLGGFWAVSLTDTLQGWLMAIAAIVLPAAALLAVGGPVALVEGLRRVDAPGYTDLVRGSGTAAAVGFVLGLLGIALGYPGQPHVVNRFMALREGEATLRRSRKIAITWALVVFPGMLLLGLCGRVLFPELADPEVIFLTATHRLLHPILAGIVVAAVLSAIMSTADSQLLVAGSAVTHDLGLGGPSSDRMLLRSRFVIVILSLAAVVAALTGTREIFSQVLFAWSAMGNAFGPLLLVILVRGGVDWRFSLVAILAGFLLSVLAYVLFHSPETKGVERVAPFVISLLIAWRGARVRG